MVNWLKSRKARILILSLFFLILIFALLFLLRLQISPALVKFSGNLAFNNANDFAYGTWQLSFRNPFYKEYLLLKGLSNQELDSLYKNQDIDMFIQIIQEKNISDLDFVYILRATQEEVEDLTYPQEILSDPNFISNAQYVVPGVTGKNYYDISIVKKYLPESIQEKQVSRKLVNTQPPIIQQVYVGELSLEEFNSSIQEFFNNLKSNIVIEEPNSIELRNIQASPAESFSLEDNQSELIEVGNAQILFTPCNYYIQARILYNISNQTYLMNVSEDIKDYVCKEGETIHPEAVEIAYCQDCTFYPIDKWTRLRMDYEPELTSIDDIKTDGEVAQVAAEDLRQLFEAANFAGLNINITSAYRSYNIQKSTFEFWINRDITLFGTTREEAEQRVNEFSARPGFSEHQLGTTVDLNAIECEAFEGVCEFNEQLWAWLKDNAHKYGFVLSYPPEKKSITGYTYEPWHYRWLGVELAGEYKAQEGELTLNQWLEQKKLYE